nr:atpase aaa type core,atpase aaa type core [Hymenolepis microstoma]
MTRRRSNIGEGDNTLDLFNFTVKAAKDDKESLSQSCDESADKCNKSSNGRSKSPDDFKPYCISVLINSRDSTLPEFLNESNASDEVGFSQRSKLVSKGRKRSRCVSDGSPKISLAGQAKRQKSLLSAKGSKFSGLTSDISSRSGYTKVIYSAEKKRRGRPPKSKSSDFPKVEMQEARLQSSPLEAHSEFSESQSNAASSFKQKIWTDRYSPSNLAEMVLNSSDLPSLLSWMKIGDSCDSSASDTLSSWRRSAYLILGPTGCGKTCLVYTLASQFGFKVFELNPSNCRSGKEVTAQCSRVMISQHVSTEGLSASSGMYSLPKSIANRSRRSQKSSLSSFFQPRKRQQTSRSTAPSKIEMNESPETSGEGLKLNNKSLILFDEVDVRFDSDKGFWVAVGKLLQMGRRPIIFTASDSTVIREIPVPFQTCRLKPLQSPTLVKPILQRICDSQKIQLNNSLMESLTGPDLEVRNCDIPNRISTTARQLFSSREFSNIRRLIVHLQWLLGSESQVSDLNGNTGSCRKDLLAECSAVLSPLFSFSWSSKSHRITAKIVEKPKIDDFGEIFDSDNEADKTLAEEKMDRENLNQVNISLTQSKKISSDVLSALSGYSEMQGLLDICSAQSGRNEITRGINALPTRFTTSSSTTNLLTAFGDVCSAPLSGIDPEGAVGSFAGEEDWDHLLRSITMKRLEAIQEELISAPSVAQSEGVERVGSYINGSTNETDLLSLAADKAAATLPILKALSVEKNSGESLFQEEFALDYLPALRHISKTEIKRQSTRRRFFHYFDQIGLRLPENVRKYLSL